MNQTVEAASKVTASIVYEDVKGWLSTVGDTLVSGATQGFDLMVKKNFWIDGVVYGATSIIFIIVGIIFVSKAIKYFNSEKFKKDCEDAYDAPAKAIVWTLVCIMAGVAIIIGFFELSDSVAHMLLPQYYAITDIIGMVK